MGATTIVELRTRSPTRPRVTLLAPVEGAPRGRGAESQPRVRRPTAARPWEAPRDVMGCHGVSPAVSCEAPCSREAVGGASRLQGLSWPRARRSVAAGPRVRSPVIVDRLVQPSARSFAREAFGGCRDSCKASNDRRRPRAKHLDIAESINSVDSNSNVGNNLPSPVDLAKY